jgi:type IV pilus assembly protein PilY1
MPRASQQRTLGLLALVAFALLPAGGAEAECDCSKLPSLKSATRYPAMSLWRNVNISGTAWTENGNIGLGDAKGLAAGTVSVTGKTTVIANIYHAPNTEVKISDGFVGSVTQQDMSGVVQDLYDAHYAFAALAPTQTFGKVSGSRTITGNGCINVIQVNEIGLSSSRKLTFKGGFDDYFIINVVGGGISLSSDAAIVLDGVEPSHIIFNVVGGGGHVSVSGKAGVFGTYLNPDKGISISGSADNRGAYYAGENLTLSASASWYGEPFRCASAGACPDPRGTGVNIQTPATPPARSSGNSSFFYSWFNTTTYEGHLESYKVLPDGSLEDESGNDPIDPITNKFLGSRDPWWDAGVRLRTDTSRKIYTTDSGARADFDTSLTGAKLGVDAGDVPSYPNYPASGVDTLAELEDAIVTYVHGKDAFDLDGDGIKTEMRSSVLGDIFHSNILFVGPPTKILAHEQGYAGFLAAHSARDRVAYAGANDAMLHAFDAGASWNQADPSAWNDGSGDELFGYVPGLLLPMASLTPKTIDSSGNRLVPGFVDGNLVAADAWLGTDSGSKTADEWATVLVSSFGDGGEGYLALDVTAPGASGGAHGPYPKLLFEFAHADLGKTWSRPVITRVKLAGGTGDQCGPSDGDGNCQERWVAIFGGGMLDTGDPDEDDYVADPSSGAWEDKSKAIFIVALDDGSLLSMVKFDSTDTTGHSAMKYSIPGSPAVLDLDYDGFADVVYIGDLGGQVWKWDISAVGTDSADVDTLIDNWASGRIFHAPPVDMGSGAYHYRQFYHPPSAAYVNGVLQLAFGSGEKKDILYQGDPARDDENRFYVVRDLNPTGAAAFSTLVTEANLTDVTSLATYADPGNLGYFFKGEESEKFISDTVVFAGHVLATSYVPEPAPTCGPGTARFYAFELSNAAGFFDDNGTAEAADRHLTIGSGVPSSPRVSMASDPQDDVVFVTTSEGELIDIEPPLRDPPESSLFYWRQRF